MVHYIYKITCLCGSLAGHYYIGKHTARNNDGYCGSGKILNDYYKKYGRKKDITYKKEILEYNMSKEENARRENEIIGNLWDTDPLCINLKKGGEGGFVNTWNKGLKGCFTEETIKKMSEAKKGKTTWSKGKKLSDLYGWKISEKQKGRKLSKEWRANIGRANLGRKVSEETRKKISKSNTGKKWDIENKRKISAPICQFTLDNVFIKEYYSCREAALDIGKDEKCYKQIWRVCKGERKTYCGFIWKYKKDCV